uniref:Uncharacterized protein MANES_13G008900 n=1 Tax=Rhizophora mucronata TaxID=61149 RepID=A0A2P2JL40_RHIMU
MTPRKSPLENNNQTTTTTIATTTVATRWPAPSLTAIALTATPATGSVGTPHPTASLSIKPLKPLKTT